jgi:hypothetical protein
MLELSNRRYKLTTIYMLRTLIDNMRKQVGNVIRKMEIKEIKLNAKNKNC